MINRLRRAFRLLAFTALFLFVAIQFVPVNWPNKERGVEISAPPEVLKILRTRCYDCHSGAASRPWYSYVAPISWWISYDVNQGVSRLDFTDWGSQASSSAMYRIAHTGHRARAGTGTFGDWMMPPTSYVRLGAGRELSKEEENLLWEWASRHGMNLDGSENQLRLHSKPVDAASSWPYVAAVGSLSLDPASKLKGEILESVSVLEPNLAEFDPHGSSHSPKNGVLQGLNRMEGDYLGEVELNQALLFVNGSVEGKIGGRGAVVAAGKVSLELSSRAGELFILSAGETTLTGGGETCRLTVVSPTTVTLQNLKAGGSIVAETLLMRNSTFRYDPGAVKGAMALPPSQRTVLNYCDRDGELAESDRRMEVLYDAGTFTLVDPEYDLVKQASSPVEAYRQAEAILAADPSMSLKRLRKMGFGEAWLTRFEELAGTQTSTTVLNFYLAEWVEEELSPKAEHSTRR